MIVANDSFQIFAANSFRNAANATGMSVRQNGTYNITETDFHGTLQLWIDDPKSRPDIVLIGGALPFSIAAIKRVRQIYDPKAIFIANGGSLPGIVEAFEWEAEGLFQGVQWDSVLPYTDEHYGMCVCTVCVVRAYACACACVYVSVMSCEPRRRIFHFSDEDNLLKVR